MLYEFITGLFQNATAFRVLAPDVDKPIFRTNGISGYQQPFQNWEWISVHQQLVFERPRFRFIHVADHVFWGTGCLRCLV